MREACLNELAEGCVSIVKTELHKSTSGIGVSWKIFSPRISNFLEIYNAKTLDTPLNQKVQWLKDITDRLVKNKEFPLASTALFRSQQGKQALGKPSR